MTLRDTGLRALSRLLWVSTTTTRPDVAELLRRGATAGTIARYLEEIEAEWIGLRPAEDRSAVGEEIVAWYRAAEDR